MQNCNFYFTIVSLLSDRVFPATIYIHWPGQKVRESGEEKGKRESCVPAAWPVRYVSGEL